MAQIALIDDDPTEALVLEGMLEHVAGKHELVHLTRVEAFGDAGAAVNPDLVLLDRRIPPHEAFDTSLPILAASGYRGPVVLMSASEFPIPAEQHGLNIAASVSKSQLLTPQAVEALLKRTLG
jgi:DNA-binding response OmpR family regulator